jgi:hypothetical protein
MSDISKEPVAVDSAYGHLLSMHQIVAMNAERYEILRTVIATVRPILHMV